MAIQGVGSSSVWHIPSSLSGRSVSPSMQFSVPKSGIDDDEVAVTGSSSTSVEEMSGRNVRETQKFYRVVQKECRSLIFKYPVSTTIALSALLSCIRHELCHIMTKTKTHSAMWCMQASNSSFQMFRFQKLMIMLSYLIIPGSPKAFTSLRLSASSPLSIWTMTYLPDMA